MSIVNSNVSVTGHVEKYIGTAYDNVKFVAENMDIIIEVSNIENLDKFLAGVLLAAASAKNSAEGAKESETSAAISAGNAASSELAAGASAQLAVDAKDAAIVAKEGAESARDDAAIHANIATTQAGLAAGSAEASAISATESSGFKDESQLWAQEAEDVPVDDGVNPSGFSAYHWAQKAEDVAATGEANTTSNSGTGEVFAKPKDLVNLPFKSLAVAGNGSIESDADTVTLTVNSVSSHDELTGLDDPSIHPQSSITGLTGALSAKAPLASPALTGTPTTSLAPTGSTGTQIASAAFVDGAISDKADNAYVLELFEISIAIN